MPNIKYSITKLHIKVLGLISLTAFLIYLFIYLKFFSVVIEICSFNPKCSFLNVK